MVVNNEAIDRISSTFTEPKSNVQLSAEHLLCDNKISVSESLYQYF